MEITVPMQDIIIAKTLQENETNLEINHFWLPVLKLN